MVTVQVPWWHEWVAVGSYPFWSAFRTGHPGRYARRQLRHPVGSRACVALAAGPTEDVPALGRVAALRETASAIGSASHRREGVAIPDLGGQALAKTAEEAADGQCRVREREWGVVGAA